MEHIEEKSFLEEYDEEDDDGLEIELHESQTKVAEQSVALLVQHTAISFATAGDRTCCSHN